MTYKRAKEIPAWVPAKALDELVRTGLIDAVIIEDGRTWEAVEVELHSLKDAKAFAEELG